MKKLQGHVRLALLALAVVVACGDPTVPVITPSAVLGTWTLQTVNGTALPFTLSEPGADYERLISDEIEFSAGGTYSKLSHVDVLEGSQSSSLTIAEQGGWTVDGNRVVMSFPTRPPVTATVSGAVLTYETDDNTYRYSRTDDRP
jgi:hypothetical protein